MNENKLKSTKQSKNNNIKINLFYSKNQKISLIGNNNNLPQIVKTGTNGITTNVEAQDKKERGKALRQVVAAFVANIGTINTGLIFGFSAVVIPQLMAPTSSITIDESQASWIGEFNFYFNLQ